MGVLQTTVVGDLCFNNLRGSNIFRDKGIVFVSRCYKSGLLKVIGRPSHDGISWKTRLKVCHQSLVDFDPLFTWLWRWLRSGCWNFSHQQQFFSELPLYEVFLTVYIYMKVHSCLQVDEVDESLLTQLAYNARGDICPMQGVIGGITAQEVMKVWHYVLS